MQCLLSENRWYWFETTSSPPQLMNREWELGSGGSPGAHNQMQKWGTSGFFLFVCFPRTYTYLQDRPAIRYFHTRKNSCWLHKFTSAAQSVPHTCLARNLKFANKLPERMKRRRWNYMVMLEEGCCWLISSCTSCILSSSVSASSVSASILNVLYLLVMLSFSSLEKFMAPT